MYKFRKAKESDFEFLRDLHHQTLRPYVESIWGWDEGLQEEMFRKKFAPSEMQIIEVEELAIGVLEVEFREKEIFLANILIKNDYQNKGIGSKIILAVIKEASNRQIPVTLTVLKNNPAKVLYEKFGFKGTDQNEVRYFMKKENSGTEL